MTFTQLKRILKDRLEDHNITLKWIIKTERPIQEKECVENRTAVYKEILEIINET